MTARYYHHSDTGAPGLGNTAGTLVALLDAILVTGYPTQSITSITRSGATATATKVAHGYTTGNVISISGAAEDEYNGNHQITVIDADTFTYAVTGTPATPATGVIIASNGKTALGWQLVYTGTNKRVYRPREGSRMYLRVDDANAQYGLVRGYETMSDVDTGTGAFPTAGQVASPTWQKTANTAGNKPWVIMGDEKQIHGVIYPDGGNGNGFFFGDFVSFKAGDAYNCLMICKTSASTTDVLGAKLTTMTTQVGLNITATVGHYIPRTYTQLGTAINVIKRGNIAENSSGESGDGSPGTSVTVFPHPVDGGIHLSRFFITEVSVGDRGYLRGVWCLNHRWTGAAMPGVNSGDIFQGNNELTGREFMLLSARASNTVAIILETSDTWDD